MVDAQKETNKLLHDSGATLKRNRKHQVWQLPNGQTFVRSGTPSDRRAAIQNLTELKRALGQVSVHSEGERRKKKRTMGRAPEKVAYLKPLGSGLADQLRQTGLTESALRAEIDLLADDIVQLTLHSGTLQQQLNDSAEQVRRLKVSNQILSQRMRMFQAETDGCWRCRLRRWLVELEVKIEGVLNPAHQ